MTVRRRGAELEQVARLQSVRVSQRPIVHQRPVLTANVAQPVPAIAKLDAGMVAREASIGQTDRILRQAADGRPGLANFEVAPWAGPELATSRRPATRWAPGSRMTVELSLGDSSTGGGGSVRTSGGAAGSELTMASRLAGR